MAKRKKGTRKPRTGTMQLTDMEELYRLLNRVQVSRKEVRFHVPISESSVIENVIKDAELPYKKKELKTNVSFHLMPGPERAEEPELDLDFLEGELFDDESDGDDNEDQVE